MRFFSIETLGCKVNQYESQQIRELLEQLGLEQVETSKGQSDLVVINTCCVTLSASSKSRRYIRRAQKLNPAALIIVCGCLPTVEIGELNNPGKNVYLIKHRHDLAATLGRIVKDKAVTANSQIPQAHRDSVNMVEDAVSPTIKTENNSKIKRKKLATLPKLPQLTLFKDHTRAFLKIQDGCDGYCSYCIIPWSRPYVRSKPAEAVLEEAQALVKAGHKEIVVTGIFLGAFGQASVRRKNWANHENDKLANLLDKMAEIPNLARIRLSSLEPADITQRLLEAFCKHHNIMPHLHLSLQSGSDAILKKMCRQYKADEFRGKIELIKSQLDRPAITADLMVGFPGETDTDFQQTIDIAKEVGFAKMHIFGFSPRKGTAAATMQDVVNNKLIKERSKILHNLDVELGRKFRQQFIGKTATILVENSNGTSASGRGERYFMVYLEKTGINQRGELVRVKLVENGKNGVIGEVERQDN